MKSTLLIFSAFMISVISCTDHTSTNISFPDGGYKYLPLVSSKDSSNYKYPLKEIISRRDSFNYSLWEDYFYKSFKEPNLSLSAPQKPVFRFVFSFGYSALTTIVSLYEDRIVIKEVETGYPYLDTDRDKLDSLEQKNYKLLRNYFPLDSYSENDRVKRKIDSMISNYPQLLNVDYYYHLTKKTVVADEKPFKYNEREIKISNERYGYFVNKINKSGYWQLTPIIDDCKDMIHPDIFIVEAATKNQYNFVRFVACLNKNSKSYQLEQVCREIEQLGQIEDYYIKKRNR